MAGIRITHNLEAMYGLRQMADANERIARSTERLSSGLGVNTSADDPAALSISEKMRAQIRGLEQSRRNSQDGMSLIQTIDGALAEVHSILQRVRDLCVKFNNDTYDASQKLEIANEIATLSAEIGRIGTQAQFNGISLLRGGGAMMTLQVGANSNEVVAFALPTLMGTINALCNPNDFFLLPFFTADLSVIDDDIDRVSQARAMMGGIQNRLEYTLDQSNVQSEALMGAESNIRDVDSAREIVELTRQQLLAQASTSALGMSQQSSRDLLQLLQ